MERLASGYGLIEGPTWDPERGLLFSDVINGGVHALAADGSVSTIVAHRRGIGGIARHASGGVVVSGRNVAFKRAGKPAGDGDTQVLLAGAPVREVNGFNDLTTDPAGRIYAGALGHDPLAAAAERKPADLYCIDLDGSARVVSGGVWLTNGLGLSPDGRLLYHCDSHQHVVRVYDVAENGDLGSHRAFARIDDGIPDGLAVAEDGSVWVAVAHGSRVEGFDPDGRSRTTVQCELPMVTSVCFGGDGLSDLYVVTGSGGSGRDDAGTVYRTRVGVAGLAVAEARVPVDG